MLTETDRQRPRLLVLVGPTAVGKTKLSLTLAEQYNAEIISGDSMQVYRGMDIGTAKATPEERARIRHHMIDIRDPDEPFSVAEFQERCTELIREIHGRGKLPFIVGGTGLYIESVCYNFQFSDAGSDDAFREEQKAFAQAQGAEALHERLKQVDPESAERLHPNDQRRIIRALEIFHVSGERLSDQLKRQKKQSPYELCIVGLTMDRALLYKRIEERIDSMMQQGLVEEVRGLLAQGCSPSSVAMQGLGYKQIAGYLLGHYSLEEAVVLLKRDTRHFAKRQLSWFRRMKDIEWVDVSELAEFPTHLEQIHAIIAQKLKLDR
ncbi:MULTISPECIES: tRNA (adenosine(37)-N6)-dimethylallyltransferase MiaA [Paenibacillus]|uniref:tRNA (adenosine(37)-N6)-dimethylallyltransferase MiaA n=1 Tax=Paenibacillus TaxID=44249 RepID=UPI0006D291DA|nr:MULTISPECIES: tRNA (adenosine(37)-N6)-dimethylallyltransferase MiaA [Paenibacillus]NTZ16962.1 tRNA (adenosine(37)-N6)-dimethylallyltransferase MiaA [Paenibacillus sp. JMULE4]GCL70303.1 tRNA (adenosine(37)-N6)-dimethylallyltransferase MiaA [Paenibacillus naphthalenovorans]SDH86353.1 tRNA dimethylallyltransferase [Paenibacillus naphthalenovorans]